MSRDAYAMKKLFAALALSVLGAASCKEGEQVKRYRVTFEVRSDRAPLLGARVSVNNRVLGQTNAEGIVQLHLPGHDGTQIPVTVTCPAGTRSPAQPVPITLRTLVLADPAAGARGIVQTVQCPPIDRTMGVIVRTDGQTNLPILWQGQVIGRTDEGGVAHLTFRVRPQMQLQLQVGTTDQPLLRPESPQRAFVVADADDVVVWDQPFTLTTPPRVRRRSSGVRRSTPVGITVIRSGGASRTFRR